MNRPPLPTPNDRSLGYTPVVTAMQNEHAKDFHRLRHRREWDLFANAVADYKAQACALLRTGRFRREPVPRGDPTLKTLYGPRSASGIIQE